MLVLCPAVALLFSAVLQPAGPPSPALAESPAKQRPDGLYAEIRTNRGVIVARLEPAKTPLAVASFVGLAEGTIANAAFAEGEPYYDGSRFHRVVPGHVIQAGVPSAERSSARGPGYTFPNEIHADLSHDHAGALGVANGGPHTNGAQFYITLGDRSYLDGDYIVFGEVVEGLDVVRVIEQGDVIERLTIERVGAAVEAFRPDRASFDEMAAAAEVRVENDGRERRRLEDEWVGRSFDVDRALLDVRGVRRFAQQPGVGGRLSPGDRIAVRYRGTALRYRGHMLGFTGPVFEEVRFGSSVDGTPQDVELDGVVFEYEVGVSSVTPGFDAVIREMRRGGEEVAVVDSSAAYGSGGFYAPDLPGRPRLAISPDTLVVYDVEIMSR